MSIDPDLFEVNLALDADARRERLLERARARRWWRISPTELPFMVLAVMNLGFMWWRDADPSAGNLVLMVFLLSLWNTARVNDRLDAIVKLQEPSWMLPGSR